MLTRHGWGALAAAAAAVVVGRLFGLLELYVLGVGLVAVAVAALVTVNRPLPPLAVRRVARPHIVAVGEPARVDIQVANRGRRRSPRLSLWEPVGDRGGASMQLAPLPADDAVTAAYRVPTAQRGIVQVGPLRAERADLLGLARRRSVLTGGAEVVVVPERVPLTAPSLGSAGALGEFLRTKAMGRSGTEFHSQREYVPGDDVRRINWKSSARSTTLIVREPALETVQRCTVVLDLHRGSYDADGFERAVSAAASVVTAAASAGVNTRLAAAGLDLRGPDVAHLALRWLATVRPHDEPIELTLGGRTHGDGLGVVVVVTTDAGAPAVRAAADATSPDEVLVVVATMDASPVTGRRFVVAAPSLMTLEAQWRRLVDGGHA